MLDRMIGWLNSSSSSAHQSSQNVNNIGGARSSSSSSSSVATTSNKADCFECRIVGGGGLSALGAYIIYYSFQKRDRPATGRASMFVAGFVGSVVMTLGFMRLIGVHELYDDLPQQSAVTSQTKKN